MQVTIPQNAPVVLDREFLTVRAKILEIAASLDRLDRAEGSVSRNPRIEQIRQALTVLCDRDANRAERIQTVFSLPYDPHWRQAFNLAGQSDD